MWSPGWIQTFLSLISSLQINLPPNNISRLLITMVTSNIRSQLKALYHAIRTDCLLMKQLGCMYSRDNFEFTNARHYLFKCIQCCIFKSSIYVGINVLVVSLQSVPYSLPTPLFFLLHCWMKNSIDRLSDRMIQLVLSLTSSPYIYLLRSWAITNGNSHSFAVYWDMWSTWPCSRNCRHPEH